MNFDWFVSRQWGFFFSVSWIYILDLSIFNLLFTYSIVYTYTHKLICYPYPHLCIVNTSLNFHATFPLNEIALFSVQFHCAHGIDVSIENHVIYSFNTATTKEEGDEIKREEKMVIHNYTIVYLVLRSLGIEAQKLSWLNFVRHVTCCCIYHLYPTRMYSRT